LVDFVSAKRFHRYQRLKNLDSQTQLQNSLNDISHDSQFDEIQDEQHLFDTRNETLKEYQTQPSAVSSPIRNENETTKDLSENPVSLELAVETENEIKQREYEEKKKNFVNVRDILTFSFILLFDKNIKCQSLSYYFISSFHHFIISSFHHFIISSFHHFIISSFHHFIISSFQLFHFHFSISLFIQLHFHPFKSILLYS
jgi:hypothetical protein